ncbi:hypothetical protein PACTADRAFT_51631 [Pachysolen tannophilus NRRL Y-2460]|uniref:Golgi SNAP receptor complex member 1 n=1 Tax=Pachysolen tannophilus NRRL Y-2460 TaxID=669874 RepID=A0A1E4TQ49_PACTA|nr:hypothetical protein PACTADRAFT_51631 [Pachysolen tannophilus NRRL Y-2460]
MSSPATASFQQTRAQVLSLENKTEAALNRYASFAQSTSSSETAEELAAQRSVEKFLKKSDDLIKLLSKIGEQDLSLPASKLQQLQRHKEVLNDHYISFGRIRGSIQQERNRLNLLFSVRNDIESHQKQQQQQQQSSSSISGGINQLNSTTNLNEDEYINDERRKVEGANSVVDRLLSDAYNTRESFRDQSSAINSARIRITSSLSQIPGINHVITRINTRKKRDALILAGLITFMIIVLWFIS